jgi:hypothetical protein
VPSPGARSLGALAAAFLLVLSSGRAVSAARPPAAQEVALIALLRGPVTVASGAQAAPRPAALFDRLAPGAVVETGAGAALTLVCLDGRRFAVGEASRVAIEARGPRALRGALRPLPSLPASAAIAPLLRAGASRSRVAAVRIRGDRDGYGVPHPVYPKNGAALLRAAATLELSTVPGLERYQVQIEDAKGEVVFTGKATGGTLPIPKGKLAPNAVYYWQVWPDDHPPPANPEDAVFVTLSDEMERRREAVRKESKGAPDLALLLAAADQNLGLYREACEALQKAAATLDEPTLRATREAWRCAEWGR